MLWAKAIVVETVSLVKDIPFMSAFTMGFFDSQPINLTIYMLVQIMVAIPIIVVIEHAKPGRWMMTSRDNLASEKSDNE